MRGFQWPVGGCRGIAAALAILTINLPTRIHAQLAPASIDSALRRDPCAPKSQTPQARFIIAPYGWMPSIGGQTGVRDLSADVDISFSELLSHLKFGAMGTFEFGYGRWLGIVDGVWASVRDDRTHEHAAISRDLDMSLRMAFVQAFAGYSFVPRPNLAIDLLAGGRLWNIDASLRLTGENIARQRERNPEWGDALGGLRVRWEPAKRWYVSVAGDGGAGGSEGTGEGMGTVGYDVARHWNVFAAYRYLHENYRKNEYFFDGHLGGPVIGAAYRW